MIADIRTHIRPILGLSRNKCFLGAVKSGIEAPFCIVRDISSSTRWGLGRDHILEENMVEINLYSSTYLGAQRMGARLNVLDQYAGNIDTLTGLLLMKENSIIMFEDEKFWRWAGTYKILVK